MWECTRGEYVTQIQPENIGIEFEVHGVKQGASIEQVADVFRRVVFDARFEYSEIFCAANLSGGLVHVGKVGGYISYIFYSACIHPVVHPGQYEDTEAGV